MNGKGGGEPGSGPKRRFPTRGKILSRASAVTLRRKARRHRRTVVFTNGCFDLLHAGHVSYLEAARTRGDLLIVGLNDDASVRRLKGAGRPLQPQADRARVLAALEAVDAVVLFGEDTPAALIEAIVPDVLVKGADWAMDRIVGRGSVLARGGRVVRVRLKPGVSTTALIERIRKGATRRGPAGEGVGGRTAGGSTAGAGTQSGGTSASRGKRRHARSS